MDEMQREKCMGWDTKLPGPFQVRRSLSPHLQVLTKPEALLTLSFSVLIEALVQR